MHDFRVEHRTLTVCRTLNYTQAAAELSLSQPAVSQHISYLEREYGAKLFTYEHKKLELTDAGRLLKGALATMAHDEQLLRERVAEAAHGQATLLRIGMTLTAGEYVVADPLVRYLAKHPEINVTVLLGRHQAAAGTAGRRRDTTAPSSRACSTRAPTPTTCSAPNGWYASAPPATPSPPNPPPSRACSGSG